MRYNNTNNRKKVANPRLQLLIVEGLVIRSVANFTFTFFPSSPTSGSVASYSPDPWTVPRPRILQSSHSLCPNDFCLNPDAVSADALATIRMLASIESIFCSFGPRVCLYRILVFCPQSLMLFTTMFLS